VGRPRPGEAWRFVTLSHNNGSEKDIGQRRALVAAAVNGADIQRRDMFSSWVFLVCRLLPQGLMRRLGQARAIRSRTLGQARTIRSRSRNKRSLQAA